MEIWKDIEGYDNYMISNFGRVKSIFKGKERILKLKVNKFGYNIICLYKEGKQKYIFIHRLVAQAFIPNNDNKPFVDHINTDRSDNRVENLRWVTSKENNNNPLTKKHNSECRKGNLNYQSKPILQLDNNMELIKKWNCGRDIERELGFDHTLISDCCNDKLKKSKGYIWKFESDYEPIPFKVFDLKIYRKKVA